MANEISGKDGTVTTDTTEETGMISWNLTLDVTVDAFHANDGDGWENNVAGVKRASGSWEQKEKPSIGIGATVALVMYTGADIWTFSALVNNIVVNTDMNTGLIVSYTASFVNKGAVQESTGSFAG